MQQVQMTKTRPVQGITRVAGKVVSLEDGVAQALVKAGHAIFVAAQKAAAALEDAAGAAETVAGALRQVPDPSAGGRRRRPAGGASDVPAETATTAETETGGD